VSSPDGGDEVDGGWDDAGGGDEGGNEGGNEGGDAAGGEANAAPGAPGDAPRRKRRRRRRGRGERGEAPQGQPSGGPPQAAERLEGDPYTPGSVEAQTQTAPQPQRPQPQQRPQQQQQQQRPPQQQRPQQQQQLRGNQRNDQRTRRDRNQPRQPGLQPSENQARGGPGRRDRSRDDGPPVDLAEDDIEAQNDLRTRAENAAAAPVPGTSVGGALKHTARPRGDEDEDETPAPAGEAWGTDDGSPAPAITLKSELGTEPPDFDPDPTTHSLLEEPGARLAGEDVASVVGVRFVPAGRVSWFDASDGDYTPGDRVVVDADRGSRLGWIATVPVRRTTRERNLRRVIRRANEQDLQGESAGDDQRVRTLRTAKDKAAMLRLPLKVFRVETGGGKLVVYYTSDDRLDLRDFVRELSQASGLRPELRQLGVRDEAKAVGGIGSCGLTLCCTTWLPDFVPVSIKMAKDQGLVLSPTKVSGQCGRLKCCLVYEQAAYAEMRKGLPKLGKRVVGARGEGRVVEVDVLRQRIRVSYGPGDTEVVPAAEVKPLFPPGNQPAREGGERRDDRRGDRNEQARHGTTPRPQPEAPSETSHDDRDAQIAALQAAHGDLDDDDDDDDDDMPDPSRDPNAED
jgi:cell fate regulator YaaT (PSP1 superfamily)